MCLCLCVCTRAHECALFLQEHVEEGRASLYNSVVSNSSKEMSCYSDFPFPEDYPNFVPNSLFLEYLQLYATQFNLLRCIYFNVSCEHQLAVGTFSFPCVLLPLSSTALTEFCRQAVEQVRIMRPLHKTVLLLQM